MFGTRWIPNVGVDRAELRTLVYRLTPGFQAGVEYNPLADDVGPLANRRVFDETRARPALILGTSSDRIGTPSGRSYYATLSKDVERETGLPLAPYAGVAYGEFESDWNVVGGLVVRWSDTISSYHVWDGEQFHNIVETTRFAPHTLGLVLAEVDDRHHLGVSWSVGFSMPWEKAR